MLVYLTFIELWGYQLRHRIWRRLRRSQDGVYEAKNKNAARWACTASQLNRDGTGHRYALSVRWVRDRDDGDVE